MVEIVFDINKYESPNKNSYHNEYGRIYTDMFIDYDDVKIIYDPLDKSITIVCDPPVATITSCKIIVFLQTHHNTYEDEGLLIQSIVCTVAHEILHSVIREEIPYDLKEEVTLKEIQKYIYPELYKGKKHRK